MTTFSVNLTITSPYPNTYYVMKLLPPSLSVFQEQFLAIIVFVLLTNPADVMPDLTATFTI